jgi:hypothetical protein
MGSPKRNGRAAQHACMRRRFALCGDADGEASGGSFCRFCLWRPSGLPFDLVLSISRLFYCRAATCICFGTIASTAFATTTTTTISPAAFALATTAVASPTSLVDATASSALAAASIAVTAPALPALTTPLAALATAGCD